MGTYICVCVCVHVYIYTDVCAYARHCVVLEKVTLREIGRCFSDSPIAQIMFAAGLLEWPSKAISNPCMRFRLIFSQALFGGVLLCEFYC